MDFKIMTQFWKVRTLQAIMLLLLTTASTPALAGSVNLSWNPNTESDLAGYRIYYGTLPSTYTQVVDVGLTSIPSTPEYTVDNLTQGIDYYLTVTAYDISGNESEFSSEISKMITDIIEPDEIPEPDEILPSTESEASPTLEDSNPSNTEDYNIDGGFGCGTIKNIDPNGGNPPPLPLDLFLLATLMLWFSLRKAKHAIRLAS